MKINPLLVPVVLLVNFIEWVRNLLNTKPKPKPVESAGRWSDSVMTEAMDSTMEDSSQPHHKE